MTEIKLAGGSFEINTAHLTETSIHFKYLLAHQTSQKLIELPETDFETFSLLHKFMTTAELPSDISPQKLNEFYIMASFYSVKLPKRVYPFITYGLKDTKCINYYYYNEQFSDFKW